jgi:hypothetical protein
MKRVTEGRQPAPVTSWPALARQGLAAVGKAPTSVAAALLTTLLLAACTGGSPAGTGPASARPETTAPVDAGPASAESGTPKPGTEDASGAAAATAAMKQTVADALGRLAAGTPRPATAQVTEALTGAGVAPGVLEVSASRTPTGLEADAIESAVLQGTDCVLGHIRDGSVTVTVLPVLASGKCFVGAAA